MISISLIIFILLASYSTFTRPAIAWWDEGHMLAAAIARAFMESEETKIIDNYLLQWGYQYPTFTNMEVAATWPDNIKCKKMGVGCDFLPFADDWTLMNHWHYEDLAHIEPNFDMPDFKFYESFKPTGEAVWVLNEILRNVKNADSHPCNEVSCELKIGSVFSWNFRLRMFIHVFADLHQPNHSGDGWSNNFPKSDLGGSMFKAPNGMTFHQYMDSGAELWPTPYPETTVECVREKAAELIKLYSNKINEFGKINYPEEIAYESFNYLEDIYKKIDFGNIEIGQTITFPDNYDEELKELCRQRIFAAGLRMSVHLKRIASILPPIKYPMHRESSIFRNSTDSVLLTTSVLISLIFILAMLFYNIRSHQKLKNTQVLKIPT